MTAPDRENTLQQYFDGELPQEEADALRAELEDDAELRAKLEGLEQLRVLLREALAPEGVSSLDGDALFASINSKLEDEDGESQAAESGPASVEPARPLREPLRAIAGGKTEAPVPDAGSTVWIGIVGGLLAAAAAVWFLVVRPGDPVPDPETPSAPIAEHLDPERGSEIETIDFGYSTGAIFQVEGQGGASYAVIWISDEKPGEPTEQVTP